ncbi:MAG TPA: hypothetical protein VHT91_29595 [Kofleriaceae bacterium]|jgi:hypothetical protein|nr:hypothetical protein [Kofleriaceae bacterium]
MKKSHTGQKLALRKDTLRVLGQLDLSEIAGGLPTTTVTAVATRCVCPSVRMVCNTTPKLTE